MGAIGFGRSYGTTNDNSCTCKSCKNSEPAPKLPNPDPLKWEVLNSFEENGYLLVELHYPDCTNYEGKKIMLYEGVGTVEHNS